MNVMKFHYIMNPCEVVPNLGTRLPSMNCFFLGLLWKESCSSDI